MKVYNISLIGTGATINESKQILMQNKTKKYNHVVYTSLVGAHSNLAPPPLSLRSKYSFLCFTDKYFECDGWDVIVMQQNKSQSPRRAAKRPKIQPWNYFTANVSVWIDANMVLMPLEFNEAFKEFMSSEKAFGIFPHNKRTNLNEEFIDIQYRLKDNPELLSQQKEYYGKKTKLSNYKLYQGGILFRLHGCLQCDELMQKWQKQIDIFSVRDQLSLAQIIYECDPQYIYIFEKFTTDIVKLSAHSRYTTDYHNKSFLEAIRWFITIITYKLLTKQFIIKIKNRMR